MAKLLQIDFPFPGPFGMEMVEFLSGLAEAITKEPGFIWKIWTEDASAKQAGGLYLFQDEATAKAYLQMHTERLKGFGISQVNAKLFDVNEKLSVITHGPLQPSRPA
ncbi:MAG: monooxygenase [Candidatus Competibacteraceae bacterium]|nr:monooxygenase [Candidatus Competibacteraceae bacterium]